MKRSNARWGAGVAAKAPKSSSRAESARPSRRRATHPDNPSTLASSCGARANVALCCRPLVPDCARHAQAAIRSNRGDSPARSITWRRATGIHARSSPHVRSRAGGAPHSRCYRSSVSTRYAATETRSCEPALGVDQGTATGFPLHALFTIARNNCSRSLADTIKDYFYWINGAAKRIRTHDPRITKVIWPFLITSVATITCS